MDGVKVFHARAAVTQNARSPIVEREVRGTISSDVDAECNRLPRGDATRSLDYETIPASCIMYAGAPLQ